MALEPIRRNAYAQPDRSEVQERVAAAVESNPEIFIDRYSNDPRSFAGRYVCSDLFKETFPEYNASRETRDRFNAPVHNSAAVLASEQFRRVLDINLTGTWNAMRLAAARLRQVEPIADPGQPGERGVFVNTASVAGLDYPPGAAPYVAAKAGVVALTTALAREFAVLGIRVMAIAPGLMDTPMLAGLDANYRARMTEGVPFPKRFGRPEEFARLVGEIVGNGMLNGSTVRLDAALRLIV